MDSEIEFVYFTKMLKKFFSNPRIINPIKMAAIGYFYLAAAFCIGALIESLCLGNSECSKLPFSGTVDYMLNRYQTALTGLVAVVTLYYSLLQSKLLGINSEMETIRNQAKITKDLQIVVERFINQVLFALQSYEGKGLAALLFGTKPSPYERISLLTERLPEKIDDWETKYSPDKLRSQDIEHVRDIHECVRLVDRTIDKFKNGSERPTPDNARSDINKILELKERCKQNFLNLTHNKDMEDLIYFPRFKMWLRSRV